jgi:hypothetical protein
MAYKSAPYCKYKTKPDDPYWRFQYFFTFTFLHSLLFHKERYDEIINISVHVFFFFFFIYELGS